MTEHRALLDYAHALEHRAAYLRNRANNPKYRGTWGARILERTALELDDVLNSIIAIAFGATITKLPLAPCVDHGSEGCPRPKHCTEYNRYQKTQEDDPYALSQRCPLLYDQQDTKVTTAGPHPGPCIACGGPCHSYSLMCSRCDTYDDGHFADVDENTRPSHPQTMHLVQMHDHILAPIPPIKGVEWKQPASSVAAGTKPPAPQATFESQDLPAQTQSSAA